MLKPLNRRTVLRGLLGGAAAGIALPALDCMLNGNGTALAQGQPLPTRFGVWFWGNGVRPEHWVPDGVGLGWSPREELAPLQRVRDYVSPVTGLHIKTAQHAHHSGMTGIMTGSRYHQLGTTRDTIVTTFATKSVDQIAADHFNGQTPFRSLEVGVARFHGTDEGTTFQHLSHTGPSNPNPAEYDPAVFFDRLFGAGPTQPQLAMARRSVLDLVNGRITALKTRVGASDRVRLDQHFESIRAIELRLSTEGAVCRRPDRPGDYADVEGREQLQEKNAMMSQLMALALACDLTRSFSVMFSCAGSGVVVWPAGAQNSMHQMCHDEGLPQPTVHRAVVFIMERLGDFLQTLRDTPEGDSNLLHNSSILCTTELADGKTHSNEDYPILVCGRGGGRLKGGWHYRSPNSGNASHAPLTALRGAGIGVEAFGTEAGRVTDAIVELLA